MDLLVGLVRQLEPETTPPAPDVLDRQRASLIQAMESAAIAWPGTGDRRPRTGGRLLAIAAAAAAVVIGVVVAAGWMSSGTAPRPQGVVPGTAAVLTAVSNALAGTGTDVEEVRTVGAQGRLDSTAWVDLATGACRTDTAVGGNPAVTVFVQHGEAVIIDYATGQWWSRASRGVTCDPLTPQVIAQDVAQGRYTVAGRGIINGRPALRLVSTGMTSGPHPVPVLTTLWVDSTTYLPVQSTSTGHLTEETSFAWLPATAGNQAVLKVAVPDGFRHVPAPPPGRQPVP